VSEVVVLPGLITRGAAGDHVAVDEDLARTLAPSAAASVALAATRGWRLASDERDAHKALFSCVRNRRAVTSSELLATGTGA